MIRYCDSCGKFTFIETCHGLTRVLAPQRYSPLDKWQKYRMQARDSKP